MFLCLLWMEMSVTFSPGFIQSILIGIKWKTTNSTLSEQYQYIIEKS